MLYAHTKLDGIMDCAVVKVYINFNFFDVVKLILGYLHMPCYQKQQQQQKQQKPNSQWSILLVITFNVRSKFMSHLNALSYLKVYMKTS